MEGLSKELLSLVLAKEVIHMFPIDNNELKYNVTPNDYTRTINLDTLCKKMKEWMIGDTNEIINTFNSSSVSGWVCTSSIYNRREIGKTELEAVLKVANYIAIERTTANPLVEVDKC